MLIAENSLLTPFIPDNECILYSILAETIIFFFLISASVVVI